MTREAKWWQQAKESIDAMGNNELFDYMLELTADSGDSEMQNGTAWHRRISLQAVYAQKVIRFRLVATGILRGKNE